MATRRTQRSVNCAPLIGSCFSTEKVHINLHIEDFDVFFGDQHRMKGEGAEQQFNKLARSVLKIAEVNDARNSEGRTGRARQEGSSSLLMELYRPLSTKSKEQCDRFLVMLEDLCKHGSVLKEDSRCLRSISCVQKVGPNAIRRDLNPSRTTCPWLAAYHTNMEPEASSQGSWYSEKYMTINRREEVHRADPSRKMERWWK